MGNFYDLQMRRFELLGTKAKAESSEENSSVFKEPKREVTEEEKFRAQESQRREKLSALFDGIGNAGPSLSRETKAVAESDEDLLYSGLKGKY